ncbi:MAG TPA: hypothetical protein VGK74_25780 [Symbiobacteriaceae bacterium]|jgi:hypothetical protein
MRKGDERLARNLAAAYAAGKLSVLFDEFRAPPAAPARNMPDPVAATRADSAWMPGRPDSPGEGWHH